MQPDCEILWYFKLKFLVLTEFIVWNFSSMTLGGKEWVCGKLSIPFLLVWDRRWKTISSSMIALPLWAYDAGCRIVSSTLVCMGGGRFSGAPSLGLPHPGVKGYKARPPSIRVRWIQPQSQPLWKRFKDLGIVNAFIA